MFGHIKSLSEIHLYTATHNVTKGRKKWASGTCNRVKDVYLISDTLKSFGEYSMDFSVQWSVTGRRELDFV